MPITGEIGSNIQTISSAISSNGSALYRNFEELLRDLQTLSVFGKEKAFLKNRTRKLMEYDRAREQRSNNFLSSDCPVAQNNSYKNLEEQFGFEGTVLLQDTPVESKPLISVLMCSTGQVLKFDKKEIIIGKDTRCDMIWTQPYVSRMHLKIISNTDQTYTILDLNSSNGTYVVDVEQNNADWRRIPSGAECTINQGAKIHVGSSEIQIL